jgi:hypothetical protein
MNYLAKFGPKIKIEQGLANIQGGLILLGPIALVPHGHDTYIEADADDPLNAYVCWAVRAEFKSYNKYTTPEIFATNLEYYHVSKYDPDSGHIRSFVQISTLDAQLIYNAIVRSMGAEH